MKLPWENALQNVHMKGKLKTVDKDWQNDEYFMLAAMAEAEIASQKGEVPIGAVIVHLGQIIARGHNLRETTKDPTAHAEMVVIHEAAQYIGHWRLLDTTLYVTLEPCVMCMGAAILARVPRLVFACRDPRAGAAGSIYDFSRDERFNHKIKITEGVLAKECSEMLSNFFRELRAGKKAQKTL
jgi:tRNA(adenine34) deaminase